MPMPAGREGGRETEKNFGRPRISIGRWNNFWEAIDRDDHFIFEKITKRLIGFVPQNIMVIFRWSDQGWLILYFIKIYFMLNK